MSSNLVKLLFAVVISMVLGYLFKPVVNLMKPARPVAEETAPQPEAVTEDDETGSLTGTTRPTAPVVVHTTPLGDSVNVAELDDKDGLADDDAVGFPNFFQRAFQPAVVGHNLGYTVVCGGNFFAFQIVQAGLQRGAAIVNTQQILLFHSM